MATGTPSKGRGALSNRTGRFEKMVVEDFDDGWHGDQAEPDARPPRTTVTPEHPKRIITRNQSPDVPFDRSINPYKGCEHGCVYCFARPTHAFLGLSPGLDFETRLFSKPHAASLLRAELAGKKYEPEPIALGANTDPYQPIERELRITRSVLELLDRCSHPATIVTKSALVLRDVDVLERMAARSQVFVYLSITTLDTELQRRLEPRAASPAKRLETLAELTKRGIPCGVLASPMIPKLNDQELEEILSKAKDAGAATAGYLLLRLPLELRELFEEWLRANYPDRADKVLSHLRGAHEGDLYRSEFGTRMRGDGPYADLLEARFNAAVSRLGLRRERPDLSVEGFEKPAAKDDPQLGLF